MIIEILLFLILCSISPMTGLFFFVCYISFMLMAD